jgi:hypothetical protein
MELRLGMGLSTAGKSFQICEDSFCRALRGFADSGRMPKRVDLSGGVVTELELGVSVYMQQGFGGEQ